MTRWYGWLARRVKGWCAKGHREDVENAVHLNEQMELTFI